MAKRTKRQTHAFNRFHCLGRLSSARSSLRGVATIFPFLKPRLDPLISELNIAIRELEMQRKPPEEGK